MSIAWRTAGGSRSATMPRALALVGRSSSVPAICWSSGRAASSAGAAPARRARPAVAVVNRASARLCPGERPPGQNHRIDAEVSARYGAFARPAATPLATGIRRILAELLAIAGQLTAEITARSQELGHLATPARRQRAERRSSTCRPNGGHHPLSGRRRGRWRPRGDRPLLQTMPGVGPCSSPPCSPSCPNSASLADARSPAWSVAPVATDSGTRHGRRPIRGGRGAVRASLYMAALLASPHPRCAPLMPASSATAGRASALAS